MHISHKVSLHRAVQFLRFDVKTDILHGVELLLQPDVFLTQGSVVVHLL